ncbi:NAD(P)-dependent oxidoreductase [Thermodesulfovibrionales bacterium]|nr:NAD(P)-dependent oxidoreductase [Thermodesulfovibrionales bacterium]
MKKVLLTGASGFIGRHTVPFLIENGYEVHAVLRTAQPSLKKESRLFWHQCDLLNPEQQERLLAEVKPTHLLHFAWYSTPRKYWTSIENLRWVQASLKLLMNFVEQGGERAVLAGTCAEYDWSYGYCSERITPTQPSTLYGTCKCSLQSILESFAIQSSISIAWGRIFFLYGPHEHPDRLISSVIRSMLKGEPARCSHGNQIRDFLHVEDVASGFIALLESEVQGAVNIASGQPIVLKDVIYKIAARLNRHEMVQLGALPAPTNESPLLVADVRRLTEEVRWKPKYNLEQGLDQTIAWWKDQISEESK